MTLKQGLSEWGFAVAGLFWLVILFLCSGQASCVDSRCDRGDLILFGLVSGAMLIPSYFGALLLSDVLPALRGKAVE